MFSLKLQWKKKLHWILKVSNNIQIQDEQVIKIKYVLVNS